MSAYPFKALDPDELEREANANPLGESGERGEKPHRPANSQSKSGESGERGEKPRGSKVEDRANGGRIEANFAQDDEGMRAGMLAAVRDALAPKTANSAPYPIEAVGPLAEAAQAIAEGAQLRPAMAGQSVLTVAALLAQGTHNVQSLDGIKPLSLSALTIADSGEGKTTADRTAQAAVRERQRQDARAYRIDVEAWETAPKKERPSEQPREPYRILRDGTVEGVRRGFRDGLPTQGLFTSEAAVLLAGYGMRQENRAKSAGVFNALWDDGEVSVARSLTGRMQLYGRRLSIHWQVQPSAAEESLSDPALTAIGFWPRFLAAWPEPGEPRSARDWRPETDARIAAFWARCNELMRGQPPEDCDKLPALECTDEARKLLGTFFERMEQQSKGPGAKLRDIKPFALRATEQAARIAGVLAAFEAAPVVTAQAVRHGIALAWYSLKTWGAIFGDRDQAARTGWALTLYGWMLTRPGWRATETDILRNGPKDLRSRSRRDTALALLEAFGFVSREGVTWTVEALSC
jgi:hypothetical protein